MMEKIKEIKLAVTDIFRVAILHSGDISKLLNELEEIVDRIKKLIVEAKGMI